MCVYYMCMHTQGIERKKRKRAHIKKGRGMLPILNLGKEQIHIVCCFYFCNLFVKFDIKKKTKTKKM